MSKTMLRVFPIIPILLLLALFMPQQAHAAGAGTADALEAAGAPQLSAASSASDYYYFKSIEGTDPLVAGKKINVSFYAGVVIKRTEMDAWGMVRRAIGDSAYHASERFEELPEVVKKAVGGPQNLREWSQMDSDTVGSVIQSNFLRTYRVVRNREREMAQMSPSLRKVIGMVTQKQLGVDA